MRLRSIFPLLFIFVLAACTVTPPLEHATSGIPISDIVRRVKCEIADAFDQKTLDPHFAWMSNWTAKIDLSLQANDQGSVTPVGTYIEPFQNGIDRVGGQLLTFPQNFSLGAGASIGAQAMRNEGISFTLSLTELRLWREGKLGQSEFEVSQICAPPSRSDLAGGLGLKEWVDASLVPVYNGDLKAGDHPSPSGAKTATGPKPAPLIGAPERPSVQESSMKAAAAAADALKSADSAEAAATGAEQASNDAKDSVRRSSQDVVLNIIFKRALNAYAQKAAAQAKAAGGFSTQARNAYKQAQGSADDAAAILKNVLINPSLELEQRQPALNDANDAVENANTAKTAATNAANQQKAAQANAALAETKPDPPVDSLSQSVQFIVAWSGSISPSWTLVRFKGPTGNLASAGTMSTHTLNIALGPTSEQGRVLTNLVIQQLRLTQGP